MVNRLARLAARPAALLFFALFSIGLIQSQTITFYADFYATQYGAAITGVQNGQVYNVNEGDMWPTNGFDQSLTVDLSAYGQDTYTVILLDDGGDGGLSYELNVTNLPFACGGQCAAEMTTGPAASFQFSLTELDGIPGCTDEAACNFDSTVSFNDGSCCFESCTTIRLYDAFSNGWSLGSSGGVAVLNENNVVVGSGTFVDGPVLDIPLCLEDGCYTMLLNFDLYAVEASWEVIRDGQVILEGGPGIPNQTVSEFFFVGMPACLVQGCTQGEACNYDPSANFNDGSCEYLTCQGCTDPVACNYDPSASIADDSCDFDCYGCTEVGAVNYDANAIYDDGTCCSSDFYYELQVGGGSWDGEISWNLRDANSNEVLYFGGAGQHSICLEVGCYRFEMFDSFQDGWNNGSYEFYNTDGTVDFSGSLDDSEFGDQQTSGSDRITLGGASCPLGCTDPSSCNFSPNAVYDSGNCNFNCYGCTDLNATNFDPFSSINDGTCVYCQPGQLIVEVVMTDAFGDGWNGAVYYISEVDGNIMATGSLDDSDLGDQTVEGTDNVCLDPGCYIFDITPGNDADDIGWQLRDVAGNFYGTGSGQVNGFGVDVGETGGCSLEGCTDAFCLNYNPSAAIDDGSCACPPANNYAYAPEALGCGSLISGSLLNATDGEGLTGTTCSGQDINAAGVWYVFNADANQQMVLSTCGTDAFNPSGDPLFDSQVFVFETQAGDIENLECLGGNDDGCATGFMSEVAFNVEQGNDYYIYVTRFSPYTTGNEFLLSLECVQCGGAPSNDACADALPQLNGAPFVGSVCCSSPDNVNVSFLAGFQTSYGVWFSFNSGDFDTFFFDLLNLSANNIGLAIFDVGECGELEAQVGCLVSEQCAGEISEFTVLQESTDYRFYVFTTDPEGCGQFQFVTTGVYLGCMDSAAPNYDSTATMDDGNCDYSGVVPANNGCGQATTLLCNSTLMGTTGGATNLGAPNLVNGCDPVPGPGVWYTLEGTGELHTVQLCGSNIDSKINVYSSTQVCGGGSPFGFSCVLTVEEGVFASETSDFINCGFFDADDAYVQFISEVGLYYYVYVVAEDSDANPITDDNGTFEVSMDCALAITGCTNAVACNYDALANIESNECDFLSCACDGGAADGLAIQFLMEDSFGDGWNGADYHLRNAFGDTLLIGSLDSALFIVDEDNFLGPDYGFDTFCLPAGCYSMDVGGGDFDEEINWRIVDFLGVELAQGTTGAVNFSLGDVVCGCTDPVACNYDFAATSDNGVCEFVTCAGCTDHEACNFDVTATISDDICCFDLCVRIEMTDDFGDGWNGAQYEIYSVDGLLLEQGGLPSIGFTVTPEGTSGIDEFCLPAGCYYILVSQGVIPVEVGWTLLGASSGIFAGGAPVDQPLYFEVGDGVCTAGCTVSVACNYDPASNISLLEDCVFDGCSGCTYEIADNYNVDAVQEDGSCAFSLQSTCPTDLNGDGATTTSDLIEFLISFGDSCD